MFLTTAVIEVEKKSAPDTIRYGVMCTI